MIKNVRSSAETSQNMTKNERFVETAEHKSNSKSFSSCVKELFLGKPCLLFCYDALLIDAMKAYFVLVSTIGDQMNVDGASDTCPKFNDTSTFTSDEADGLSDIDDFEVYHLVYFALTFV